MEIVDISRDLLKTPAYPGNPESRIETIEDMKRGDHCNVSAVSMCLHNATHIDAPKHFIDGGDDISKLPLSVFVGECTVVEVPHGPVTGQFVEDHFPSRNCERLLIKGDGLSHLMESSAYAVADSGVKLIGTDAPTIGSHGSNEAIHRALLGNDIAVLEGLDLSNVEAGKYFLIAQPLKISGAEAAPCRAVLVKDYLFWSK